MELHREEIERLLLYSGLSFLLTLAVLFGGYSLLFQG